MTDSAAATPDPTIKKPPRRKRWIPLSLRVFAALLVTLGLGGTWVGVRGYLQLSAIRKIEGVGGVVNQTETSPRWLREFVGKDRIRMFDEVAYVAFDGNTTDAELDHLPGLTSLHTLSLPFTQVTDAGLIRLRGLTSLQALNLTGTQVTDAGLLHLRGFTNLKALDLPGTRVTDAGLAHMRGLTSLQFLSLDGTQVTDAGLEHLRGLTSLRELWLNRTQVTDAGIADLRRALPDLHVE
jgi:Leucine Rich repeat